MTVGPLKYIKAVQIMLIEELNSLYLPFTEYFKHHLQFYKKITALLMFYYDLIVC